MNAVRVRRAGASGRGSDGAHGGLSAIAVAIAGATGAATGGEVLELPVPAAATIGVLPLPPLERSDSLWQVALFSALDKTAGIIMLAESSSRGRFSAMFGSLWSDF